MARRTTGRAGAGAAPRKGAVRRSAAADQAAIQKTVLDALRRLVRSFRVGTNDGGPSPAQRFVLERLAEHPGASIGELARMTHTDQSSVSVVVSRLVEAGFVERRRSEDDARRAELSLTTRGRALARKGVPSGQAQLLAGLASLSAPRRAALARELEALCDAMGIRDEPAGMFFDVIDQGAEAPDRPKRPGPATPRRKSSGAAGRARPATSSPRDKSDRRRR